MSALDLTASLVDRLRVPLSVDQPWLAQSLGRGAAGVALVHIERAHSGSGTWRTAHDWIRAATSAEISTADTAGLYGGVPAISFILHAAGADGVERYESVLPGLDAHVINLTHRRVDAALAHIARGEPTTFAEYDLFTGLTGIGRLLLEYVPENDALGRVLDYLVRLTYPLRTTDGALPGWWVPHDPDPLLPTPGGHANVGLAHGVTGPLALLGTALRRGIAVDGQIDAIEAICAYLDAWRQEDGAGSWWPQWITLADSRSGRTSQAGPLRPSWCYGTPGIARAQQIAAIAIGDLARQQMAEAALAACLSDADQLARITEPGLCHGAAGLYLTAWRAANDATSPTIRKHLPRLGALLTRHAEGKTHDTSFLDGTAGTVLALQVAVSTAPPTSGWDSCLLIS